MNRLLVLLTSLLVLTSARADPAPDRTLVARPFASGEPIHDLALAEDGELVLGACQRHVALWEARSGRRLGELPGEGSYAALVMAGETLVTGEHLGSRVRAWNVGRRELLAEVVLDPGHKPLDYHSTGAPPEPTVALAAAPDGRLVAVAWKDEVRVLRVGDLSLVRLLRLPGDREEEDGGSWQDLHTLSWSADGRFLRAWDFHHTQGWSWDVARAPLPVGLPRGDPRQRDQEWAQGVTPLRDGGAVELRGGRAGDGFSYRLVRLGVDGAVRWSTPVSFRDVAWRQSLLALEARGQVLLAGPSGGALTFSLEDGSRWDSAGPQGMRGLFAGTTGETLVLWDDRNGLWIWDAAGTDPYRLMTPLPPGDLPGQLAVLLDVDPSQRYAAAELEDGHVLLWELRSGRLLRRWRDGDQPNLTGLAVRARGGVPRCFYNAFHGEGRRRTEGGRTIVDYSRGVRLVARDATDHTSFEHEPELGTHFLLGPRGRVMLVNESRQLVELETGVRHDVPHAFRFVSGRALSTDGKRVAVAGLRDRKQSLVVFEKRAGVLKELRREALNGVTQALAFSPDGARVAAVDRVGALLIDLEAGARRRIALPNAAKVAFLPDGRVAIGGRDGSVTIWSLED